MRLIVCPDNMTAFLVRVNPREVWLPDGLTNPDEPDLALWLIEGDFDDQQVIPLDDVCRLIASWMEEGLVERHGPGTDELMADTYLLQMLHHPKSPYGLGYRMNDPPEIEGDGTVGMIVIYHGKHYTRDEGGVLTPLGTRDDDWPTPEQWRRGQIWTRLIARRLGIL